MRVLIIIKGGSSQVEGEVAAGNEDELLKELAEPGDFLVLTDTLAGKIIVNKSSIGYIKRKR